MKKALIHDWYYVNGGAEKVIRSINSIWDDLDHFALIDFLSDEDRENILVGRNKDVTTSFIQNLPTARSNHRKFLELFPLAIEQFNLKKYDLIISSSASIAKGVLRDQNQMHISYVHSPMRYAWDLYHQYLENANLGKGLKGWYAKRVLHKMRMWDQLSTNRVDHIVANSKYISKRIDKVYRRESTVIYPPVNTQDFQLETEKEDYYFTASRLVPYKKVDLIVKAFENMPNKKLIVAGGGPGLKYLRKIAPSNVSILGEIAFTELKERMQKARAFIFASEEDFGIVPVEAQACGTPVIGFGKGGLLETVVEGETGLFFDQQSAISIENAVMEFEQMNFVYEDIRRHSEKFSVLNFEKKFKDFVDSKI